MPTTRAGLLDQLRLRLEAVETLTLEMQAALKRADASAIDNATARLETLMLEFKLLHAEYHRISVENLLESPDAALEESRARFDEVALRVARSAAVGSGILERLVGLTRGLVAALSRDSGDGYVASGEAPEPEVGGLRLKETV